MDREVRNAHLQGRRGLHPRAAVDADLVDADADGAALSARCPGLDRLDLLRFGLDTDDFLDDGGGGE